MQVEDESQPIFFPVSVTKLLVLSVCTFGVYELYWFFKNWQLVSTRTGGGRYVAPAIQTLLTFFLCYSLFKRVSRVSQEVEARPFKPGWLAISWIAVHLSQRLPDPYWVLSLASVVPLLVVQRTANEINAALRPACSPNARFSASNFLACVLGAGVLTFGLVDTFAPELVAE
jgi:hypothetical protein